MPLLPRRRSIFHATGRALGVCLLLVASAAAQEEVNLGLARLADGPQRSPAFVSFVSSSYGTVQFKENDARGSLASAAVNFSLQDRSLNVSFDQVVVKKTLRPNSFELMKQHVFHSSSGVNAPMSGWRIEAFVEDWRFGLGDEVIAIEPYDPSWLEPIRSERLREFLYGMKTSTYGALGVRLNSFDSGFSFEGLGSILGRTAVDQTIDHTVIGPQLALGAVAESSYWRFEAVVMGMAGYQRVKYEQGGVFGEELIPGALNRPITNRVTTTINERDEDKFAWQAETRLTASCQLTHHWRFDATWRGFVTGPVYVASESVVYSAPSFGMREPSGDEAYGSDLFIGLSYLH